MEPQLPSYRCLRGWGAYCGREEFWWIFTTFIFFLSTCYPTLFLCLGRSCSMCLSKRPRQAEAPARSGRQRWGSRGAETVGAVFQAQSSRHTAHGALRDLSVGGLAGALGSMMLLPDFVSVASTSLTSFLLTSEPHSPPSRNPVSYPTAFWKFWSFCHNTDLQSIIGKRTPGISVGTVELLLPDSLKT